MKILLWGIGILVVLYFVVGWWVNRIHSKMYRERQDRYVKTYSDYVLDRTGEELSEEGKIRARRDVP